MAGKNNQYSIFKKSHGWHNARPLSFCSLVDSLIFFPAVCGFFFFKAGLFVYPSPPRLWGEGGGLLTAICTWFCQSWILFVDSSGEADFQLLDHSVGRAVVDPDWAAALGPEGQQGQLFVEFWDGWKRMGR